MNVETWTVNCPVEGPPPPPPPPCGNSSCETGEDCVNCPADCGPCAASGCGDGICDTGAGETCSSCSIDCGACATSCSSGTCMIPDSGQTNCGGWGMDPGSGSCTGGFCCVPKGTWGGCLWGGTNCTGYGGTPGDPCCTPLVVGSDGRCWCPSACTANLNTSYISMFVGESQDIRVTNFSVVLGDGSTSTNFNYSDLTRFLTISNDGSTFSTPFQDNNTPYISTITGMQPGQSRYRGQVFSTNDQGVTSSCNTPAVTIDVIGPVTGCVAAVQSPTITYNPTDAPYEFRTLVNTWGGYSNSDLMVTLYAVNQNPNDPTGEHLYVALPDNGTTYFDGTDRFYTQVPDYWGGTVDIMAIVNADTDSDGVPDDLDGNGVLDLQCSNTGTMTVDQCQLPHPSIPLTATTADACTPADVTFTWNRPGNLDRYDQYHLTLYRDGTPVDGADLEEGINPIVVDKVTLTCDNTSTTRNVCEYTYNNLAQGGNYQLGIRTYHSTFVGQAYCSASDERLTPIVTVNSCNYSIGGDGILEDDTGLAYCYTDVGLPGLPRRCTRDTSPPGGDVYQNPGGTSFIRISGIGDFPISNPGPGLTTTPVLEAPAGTYLVELFLGDPANWFCYAPNDCRYSVTVGPDDNSLSWFIATTRRAWYQVQGGDVHANLTGSSDVTFGTQVPFSCESDPDDGTPGDCRPYAILRDQSDTENSSGIVTQASGTIDVEDAAGNQASEIDQDGLNRVATTTITSPIEDYDFFYRLLQMPLPVPLAELLSPASSPPDPVADPPDYHPLAYYAPAGYTVDNPWTITGGTALVIFVPGDLNLNAPITVDPGSFLAFIVAGNINISPDIGYADANQVDGAQNLEGIYIAQGQINTGTYGAPNPDNKLVAEGTFVAWQGFNLQRDLRSSSNNYKPAELFRFRPDLIINAPYDFRRSPFIWREVAP